MNPGTGSPDDPHAVLDGADEPDSRPCSAGQLFGLGQRSCGRGCHGNAAGEKCGSFTLWQLFSGNIPGMLGETCKLTLLLGGIYLIARGVIDWRIPVFLLWVPRSCCSGSRPGTIYSVESGSQNALYQLLSWRPDAGCLLHGDGLCNQSHHQAGALDRDGHWLRC